LQASSLRASFVPGWYEDPFVTRQWRWWTGASWTEHVAPRTVSVALTPGAAPAAPAAPSAAPSSTAPPSSRHRAALGLALTLAPVLLFGLLGAVSAVHLPRLRNLPH
jgi:hypothetical protein